MFGYRHIIFVQGCIAINHLLHLSSFLDISFVLFLSITGATPRYFLCTCVSVSGSSLDSSITKHNTRTEDVSLSFYLLAFGSFVDEPLHLALHWRLTPEETLHWSVSIRIRFPPLQCLSRLYSDRIGIVWQQVDPTCTQTSRQDITI